MRSSFFSPFYESAKKSFTSVPLGTILFYFLASRFLIIFLAVFSNEVIRPGAFSYSGHLIDMFNHWDAGWYLNVARNGYFYSLIGPSDVGYAPLYPTLVHLGSFLFRDFRLSGYFISNACLFASSIMLWKLVARNYGNRQVADRAVLFLLINPVSFFFSTIYTESLFFLLFVTMAHLAAERRWLLAGIAGYFTSLSRLVAILAIFLLVAEYLMMLLDRFRQRRDWLELAFELKESGSRFAASILLTFLGFAMFCCYLGYRFGDPLAFNKAEVFWGRHFTWPWNFLRHDSVSHMPFYTLWFDDALALGLVLFITGLILKIRLSHSVIAGVYLLLYLSTNLMESMPRYLSVLFPFYITLAIVSVRWPRLEPMLIAGSAMLLMLSTILFVNGYWFT